jgi:hypothetical protein
LFTFSASHAIALRRLHKIPVAGLGGFAFATYGRKFLSQYKPGEVTSVESAALLTTFCSSSFFHDNDDDYYYFVASITIEHLLATCFRSVVAE